jgi:hypothetical protein
MALGAGGFGFQLLGLGMKKYIKGWFHSKIYNLILEIQKNTLAQQHSIELLTLELRKRAISDTAEFIRKNMKTALIFKDRENFWDYVLTKSDRDGICLEFGVHSGTSITYLASRDNRPWFGFDSFEGIKDDWHGTSLAAGGLTLNGKLPTVPKNVSLIKGYFEDSLNDFLSRHSERIAIVHIDSDTYSACNFVLTQISRQMYPGTIIIFDEYFGYHNWECGEYLAFQEFATLNTLKFRYLACTQEQVAIIIL